MLNRAMAIKHGLNPKIRILQLSTLVVLFLLLVPLQTPFSDPEFVDPTGIERASSENYSLSDTPTISGTAPPLSVSYSGEVSNVYDPTFVIDSSTSELATVTVSDGWTGSTPHATIDTLSMDVNDVRNSNMNTYHNEKWVEEGAYQSEDVTVPNSWTLTKATTNGETGHPLHGIFEMNDVSSAGYSGTMGWRFDSVWSAAMTVNANDQIYLSQMVSIPYREVYSAQITFSYYVLSTSSLADQVVLFVRFNGYQTTFNVFESGDTTNTWLTGSVTIPAAQIAAFSVPNSILLEIGMKSNVASGSQAAARTSYAYVDNVALNLNIRPFPEQIDLKVNGTSVVGATKGSIYPYVPDNSNRDAQDDDSGNGVDLDGWPWGTGSSGILYVGGWGGAWTTMSTYEVGFQFPVDIPQGAVITSAYLEVEPVEETGLTYLRIYAAGQNSSGLPIENFTTGLPVMEDRFNWIDTSIDWTVTDVIGPVRIRQRSPDISPLIQAIVADSNWISGNYTCLMLDYMWSNNYQGEWGIKGSSGTNNYPQDELARLFVEYMVPLPEDTAYFMQHEKDITIDHTQVVSDLTDFPVLIELFDTDLKTDVQSDGDDIVFRLNGEALDFEIELFDQSYNGTHAHLIAWVKIPSLSSSVDTTITMAYGNPDAPSSSSTSVWDNYATVQHLAQDPSSTEYDSTSNNYEGTSYGSQGSEDFVTGLIGNAIDFDSTESDVISIGQINTDTWNAVTVSMWAKMDVSADTRIFSKAPSTSPTAHIITIRLSSYRMTARIQTDGYGGGSYDANTTFSLGTWNLFTWTWSASSGKVIGYMNGLPVIDVAHGGTSIYNSIDVFAIGNTDLTNARYFDGTLDEGRLSNRVLSQAWVRTEYNNQIDPASFISSIGSERTLQSTWVDDSIAHAVVTTNSPVPITTDFIFALDIAGSGQSLDESYNPGATYYATNGSEVVDWHAYVMISPPNTTSVLNTYIEYPMTEWSPVAIANPLGTNITYGTDWDFEGGTITIYSHAIDYWGVWNLYFESWNYLDNMQLGINGQALGNTATFDINNVAKFQATTPWIENSRVGLELTDPTGSVWYSTYATTGTPGTTWHIPSFRYRVPLTVPANEVNADLTNYPLYVSFADITNFPSKVQTDGDDFVFVQNDIVLAHELELYNSGTGRLIAWVKTNLSSTVDNTIYLYYGNPVVGSCASPTAVWTNGYEAVWHLNEETTDEATNGLHYDSSGNDYTGNQNGNSLTSGLVNSRAQAFDGNDFITINSTEGLNPSGDLTISGWFYLGTAFSGASSTMILVDKYLDGDYQFHIALAGADYTEPGVPAGSMVFSFDVYATERVTYSITQGWAAGWHHFSCYLDVDAPANNKIYINGFDNTGGQVGAASTVDLGYIADWTLGGGLAETAELASGQAYLTGRLEEVRISLGSRSTAWIAADYNNTNIQSTFVSKGSESTRTSPELSITKTMDSSAPAGLWTATMYYNDTGSSVTNKTGVYERNFIVQHDTTLTLNYPADAISDKIAYATAGEPIYIEYELTDDITAGGVPGVTVKLNWTVSGTPTEITMDDLGDGRYGKTLDTDDLIDNQAWRIDVWSSHPYYNDATDFFTLELYHATNMTYRDVESTPAGYDFTATLVFYDSYTDTPITGATITFDNGTAVPFVDEGNGLYSITVSTSNLGYGDHWYRFNATKASAYLEEAYVNVTFTLRKHYTTVSVSGDLVTPSGFTTNVTVTIIDTDTGGTIAIGDVSAWTFDPASYGNTPESSPSDFAVTLDTTGWSLGTESVTLEVILSGIYFNPSNYTFDIEIRKHYTAVTVIGDFLTPHGYTTTVTVVLTDIDTGTTIASTTDIISWLFDPASYGNTPESNPTDFDVTIDTSSWAVGTDAVTLSVVMTGIYQNPTDYTFDIEIRKHFTSVTVSGDLTTPYGEPTSLIISITDLDTGLLLGSTSSISSWLFSSLTYGDTPENTPADFLFSLDTTAWSVGTETVTLSVVMTGIYYSPNDYDFDIEIRKHRTALSILGEFTTPSGLNTSVTIVITDLDNGSILSSTSYISSWSFTSSYAPISESSPIGDFDVLLDTDGWAIGTETVTLSVTMTGIYLSPSNVQFDIEIRKHYTSVTVIGNLITPAEFNTTVTVVITDSDLGTILSSTTNVASWTFTPTGYGAMLEPLPGDFLFELDTDGWAIGTDTVTFTVSMNGIYENPASYDFDVQIRKHYTAVSVSGDMVSPYSNTTDLTVIITDLDINSVLGSTTNILWWYFNPASYSDTNETPVDFDVTLDTSSWAVGTETVTLSVSMSGIYSNPSSYQFTIRITSLDIDVYNEPNDLIFPTGSDFKIIVRVNVSEPGSLYGTNISSLVKAEFSVTGYTIKEWYSLGFGRYNFTIDASSFPDGISTITLRITTTSSLYGDATLQITFRYRAALSEASSPDRAIVTPYDTDFVVSITYIDIDRSTGITGASISIESTEGITFYNEQDLGGGLYEVTINVTSLVAGEHFYNLTIYKAGYDAAKLTFKVVIRIAYTYAIPTVGALDIPVGDDPVFYVEFWDIDHDVPITDEAPFLASSTWIHPLTVTYLPAQQRYRVVFPTFEDDSLVQNLIVTFNFSKGANYQFGIFNLSVTIRTHYTDFRLVSAIEPTSYTGNITISVFYGDLDSGTGIASRYVLHTIINSTGFTVTSYIYNDTLLGGGYYTLIVPAGQFGGPSSQTFTIYFNWTGPVSTYENRTLVAGAEITGEGSRLTLLLTAEPTPYLENMTYTIFYSALNGTGIYNITGNVHISVEFVGLTIDLSGVDIWEINPVTDRGEYSIQFNNSIFGKTGLIYMKVYINWTTGVAPYYTNRLDTISVRVLPRDTLISVDPPSQTAYLEDAEFSFTFDDVTGTLNEPIANASALTIQLSLGVYTLAYDSPSRTFTVTFSTSQFPGIGKQTFTLSITWVGAPFYANQTGKSISVTVILRQTLLDYQTPAPTQYLDNVTFSVTWTDVAGAVGSGIESASIVLYDSGTPIPSQYYSVLEIGSGEYEITLNTTYKASPGSYSVNVTISSLLTYYADRSAVRTFTIQYRSTLVSAEPVEPVAFNDTIVIIFYYRDLLRLNIIGNDTFDVSLVIDTPGTWIFTSQWQSANEYYVLTIETYNQPGLQIGVQYNIQFSVSFSEQSPYYGTDNVVVYYELRYRASSLERTEAPIPTPYLDYSNFTVYFSDADASVGIVGAEIYVSKGVTDLVNGSQYLYLALGSGYYEVSVLTSVLDGLGTTAVTVFANWTSGSPYHDNATISINLNVIRRVTNVEIVTPPSQTNYLENVTFVVSFVDLATSQKISATKSMISILNGGVPLTSNQFSITEIGATLTYEISIDSEFISATLVINRQLTVSVDWPDSPNYYQDDSTSTRVTLIARSTYVSVDRPANTAYGENATFTFTFVDSTNVPEVLIANSSGLMIATNLSETPSLSYNSGTQVFTISFNTAQFMGVGQYAFYLNVTWAGSPFYANKTLQIVYTTVIYRQTQVDFQAPAPTPFGDNVTFTIWFLDIAGATETGIPDATLTLRYLGSLIASENYAITPGGDGSFVVEFYSGYFAEPGTYTLNASLVYTGADFKEDNFATRPFNVRYRTTVLSSDPVGSIGYGTTMSVTLYFQDQLTLVDIANSSNTFFTILNDTGTPWDFTVSWNGALGQYDLLVETNGQPLSVGVGYTLHLNMSYAYQSPYYRWDDAYIEFSIRTRTSSLDIFEGAQPTSYLEYITFIMYYWDVDVVQGIGTSTTFSIENKTHTLVLGTDFYFTQGTAGYYTIYLNSSSLSTLGSHTLRVKADWIGGTPYHNDAFRNITVSVIRRTTEVEIVSPPSSTQYLDNVTFTFRYSDTIALQPIIVTTSDVSIYANGTLLTPGQFVMNQVGSIFEVEINSTLLSANLVTSYNITLVIDWNDTVAPYYEDAVTSLKVSTKGRTMFVEVGAIETTPYGDLMNITFQVLDDTTGLPVTGVIILFSCQTQNIAGGYTIYPGTGIHAGQYNISLLTSVLVPTPSDLGSFKFDLDVHWDSSISPFYRNRTTIVLTGSVDAKFSVLQAEAPQPSSVQITDSIYIIVEYQDIDHDEGIDGANIEVRYMVTGIIPQGLSVVSLGSGLYNISFSTIDLDTLGTFSMNITASRTWYTTSEVNPSFSVIRISTLLVPGEPEIQLNWTESAYIQVEYQNLLNDNSTPGATVTWTYGAASGTFAEIGATGFYEAYVPTSGQDSGTRIVSISANKTKFSVAVSTVTLIVLALPSDMKVATPEEVFEHPRGDPIPIKVFLNDTYNDLLIDYSYVTDAYVVFNSITYPLTWNSTDNSWYFILPSSATEVLEPGYVYSARITAKFRNYNPVSSVFKIDLLATRTFLEYHGDTSAKMEVYYSDFITFELNFTDVFGTPIDYAEVFWIPEASSIPFEFANISGGIWSLSVNSTAFQKWGTFGITFSGVPEDPNLDSDFVSLTVTVKKIPTEVISPPISPISVYWGWSGNISFTLNDIWFDQGVPGANISVTFDIPVPVYDLGNGTYLFFIDTSLLDVTTYRLLVTFQKENYDDKNSGTRILVENVPTELVLTTPPVNWIEDDPTDLQVPFGESVTIRLFFNDTDDSEGYVGGLAGATNITSITGGLIGVPPGFVLEDLGNGTYTFTFDTLATYLFPDAEPGAQPTNPYYLNIRLELLNRASQEIRISIEIIKKPTTFTVTSSNVVNGEAMVYYGDTLTIDLKFAEDWNTTRGTGIDDVNFSVTISGQPVRYEVQELGGGVYRLIISVEAPIIPVNIEEEESRLVISFAKENYEEQSINLTVKIAPTEAQQTMSQAISWGTPALFFILLIGFLWVRIFSVPKRLRQINGQIKALRKGKIPKPIDEVRDRQQIVADLYNDTNKPLNIIRTPDMMPEESVPVNIPEMGELLIQLSILTHLSPDELDEFKADISKMKMSEQAAFVKEVIDQEAIRAARREGVSMEEILERIDREARVRLSGEEAIDSAITKPEVDERIFLTPDEELDEEVFEEPEIKKPDIAREIRTEEPMKITDKLSDYEIEELRKDLQAKGVQPHEIDTIIEQARELPRDLVEELLKSLDIN